MSTQSFPEGRHVSTQSCPEGRQVPPLAASLHAAALYSRQAGIAGLVDKSHG